MIEASVNAGGMEIPMKMTILNKIGFRMDMSIMGMDNYEIVNTKEGYTYYPIQQMKTPEKMTDDDHKIKMEDADLQGEFFDYQKKGIKIELQGEEDIEGTMCYKVLCIMPSKSEKRLFIDKETFQVIRSITKSIKNGKEEESQVDYSNFKLVDGLVMPYEMSMGQMGILKISKYTINLEVKEELFQLKK